MTESTHKALLIPEILIAISGAIPIFDPPYPLRDDSDFTPQRLLPCVLVNRLWHQCFLPRLYHHFLDRPFTNAEGTRATSYLAAFRKHPELVRRYKSIGVTAEKDLPFEKASPPTNLVSLILFNVNDAVAGLLRVNQGPQLKQLTWCGAWKARKIEEPYQQAMMNLPCLEELALERCVMSDELLQGVFRSCSQTLQSLKMASIAGFNEGLILGNNDEKPMQPPRLSKLTRLTLMLDFTQSRASVLLPQICPALERLDLTVELEDFDLELLTRTLRAHCPQLTSLHYKQGYSMLHEYGFFPKPTIFASLFQDSTPHLRSASMRLPFGLDLYMENALLCHAMTLENLELRCCVSRIGTFEYQHSLRMDETRILLMHLTNLRNLKLLGVKCAVQSLEQLISEPWSCHGLETLVIDGYLSQDDSGKRILIPVIEKRRKRIRQNAWPRKFRQHEYRDEGWFLEAGLGKQAFTEALFDGEIKRKILVYLSRTMALKKLRTVRLNETEFFREEQVFKDAEAERSEMEQEEDLVVDYRAVKPIRKLKQTESQVLEYFSRIF